MKSVSTAGAAPTSMIQRHESFVTGNTIANTAISAKPTFAAAPMTAASIGRLFSGQISMTSATPSAHSPPIPSAATKRDPARCHGSAAKYPSPVKSE